MEKYDEAYLIASRALVENYVIRAEADGKSAAETTVELTPLGSAGSGTEIYGKILNLVKHIRLENDTESKSVYHPAESPGE